MEMIALIVSGLALLAAGECLYLLMQEKKRNQDRNAAMLNYVQVECEAVSKAAGAYTDEIHNEIMLDVSGRFTAEELEMHNAVDEKITHAVKSVYARFGERIENLEKGIIPDYEKATAAVNAVNDFNQGISNLLNYDPVSALAAQRERERQGE